MKDLLFSVILAAVYVPLSLVINRFYLKLRSEKRDQPAQGTLFKAALLSLLVLGGSSFLILGEGPLGKVLWTGYLVLILSCQCLVFISVMCVSESGRRFYLLGRIAGTPGISLNGLRAHYRGDDMLDIRLERLLHWGVFALRDDRLYLQKPTAYITSLFFYLWGRLLGFRWLVRDGRRLSKNDQA